MNEELSKSAILLCSAAIARVRIPSQLSLLALAAALTACGGGGGGGSNNTTFTVGATVTGLTGSGLVLQNNGGNNLAISANGAFTFTTALANNAAYAVTVLTQPRNPAQVCTVANGNGTITGANVATAAVSCVDSGSGGGGDQFGSGPDPTPSPSGSPTSVKLIAAARDAGTITAEQALIYDLYADFGDSRLPAQFKGDDVGQIEGNAFNRVAAYIAAIGEANVSTATLDALRPYITPPYYAGSAWQPAATAQIAAIVPNQLSAPSKVGKDAAHISAAATPTKIGWVAVPGTNVVVWYKSSHAVIDAGRAAILVSEFDNTIWPKLTTLMGRTPLSDLGTGGPLALGLFWTEDDGRLDVFLDDLPDGKEGRTLPVGWKTKKTPVRIYLSRALSAHGLIANAAHEFMHAIQYSYDVKASGIEDYRTIKEATAAWATHYVYPSNQWETAYAKHYITRHWTLSSYDDKNTPDEFPYGAYVFPLFLESRLGPDVVKGIWDSTDGAGGNSTELPAIDAAIKAKGSDFAKEWAKFAAALWNQETLAKLVPFNVKDIPDVEAATTLTLVGGFGSAQQGVDLEHAAIAFYRVNVLNADTRSLIFANGLNFELGSVDPGTGPMMQFTGLDARKRNGASMQVFLKVNGVWQSDAVDLSNVPFYPVCRDDPAGKIEEIVFIYSNGEITPGEPNYTNLIPQSQNPGIVATDLGCRDWSGSLSMSRPLSPGTETLKINGVKFTNTMPTAAPTPGVTTAYPLPAGAKTAAGYGFIYKQVSGTATWTYNSDDGHCVYKGSETFSAVGAGLPVTTFGSWALPGAAHRALILPGFAEPDPVVINRLTHLPAGWRCVDSQGNVTTGTAILGTQLNITVEPLNHRRIVAGGGLSIGGDGTDTGKALTATGVWSLTGSVN